VPQWCVYGATARSRSGDCTQSVRWAISNGSMFVRFVWSVLGPHIMSECLRMFRGLNMARMVQINWGSSLKNRQG
jgi:hypothetical protein